jgi:copper homeostasis protein
LNPAVSALDPRSGEYTRSRAQIALFNQRLARGQLQWIDGRLQQLSSSKSLTSFVNALMAKTQRILEVCVASVEDALAAEAAGADRLELNMALELGGLTPTASLLQEVKHAVQIPVIAMIRPRAGGFCYSRAESLVMMRDAELLLGLGADGLVAGALLADGTMDCRFWQQIGQMARGRETVFHRAFDVIRQQEVALRQLIDFGTTRVLTSGGRVTALEGSDQIARLKRLAGGRIEVLPAAGITPENVSDLIRATGCDQVHGSFRERRHDPAGCVSDGNYPGACFSRVAAARAALDNA